MKYRHDPDRPAEPILEASPREIDAHRDRLRRYLRIPRAHEHRFRCDPSTRTDRTRAPIPEHPSTDSGAPEH